MINRPGSIFHVSPRIEAAETVDPGGGQTQDVRSEERTQPAYLLALLADMKTALTSGSYGVLEQYEFKPT